MGDKVVEVIEILLPSLIIDSNIHTRRVRNYPYI